MSDEIRKQVNDIIEADIQLKINDYLEEKDKKKESGVGFNDPEDQATKLNVKVSQNEIDKILKEYKRIKKQKKSNLGQVKKMGLVDKDGKPL